MDPKPSFVDDEAKWCYGQELVFIVNGVVLLASIFQGKEPLGAKRAKGINGREIHNTT